MTWNNGNKLTNHISSSLLGLQIVRFEEMSCICRLYKNKAILDMA